MDAAAMLAYLEVATVGLLGVVVVPVLLAMGAAAFAPMIAAVKRVALGWSRRPVPAITERAASFEHLPGELATLGHDTLELLAELDHFSRVSRPATTVWTAQPRHWWQRLGATFGDASGYHAETHAAQEVWQWVFGAERLSSACVEDLRALGIDLSRVRGQLLSSSSLRGRLPALLHELERVADALGSYAGADYRGRPVGHAPLRSGATVESPSDAPDCLRVERYRQIERRYGRLLRRIAARHTTSSADRDDLLQDIRLAIWNALPAYRGESSLRTYAVRIAHKRAASALRRSGASTELSDVVGGSDLEQQLETATRLRWLTRALAQLSPGIADALQRRLAGDSYQEIADALGITTSNVGVRLHTGKAKLRALAAEER